MTEFAQTPRLTSVPNDQTASAPVALGIPVDGHYRWVESLWTPEVTQFLLPRWDATSGVFTWEETDRVSMSRAARGRSANLAAMTPTARMEWLLNAGTDHVEGHAAMPPASRMLASRASETQAISIRHLPVEELAQLPKTLLRRWSQRLEYHSADPEAEWLRDDIRLRVVDPTSRKNNVLRVGLISQPWLRDLLVDVVRVRLRDATPDTISKWTQATQRVSRVIEARSDQGLRPARLNARAMDAVVRTLQNDRSVTDGILLMTIKDFGAVLTSGRALGFADRIGLPGDFRFRKSHYPEIADRVEHDRGFPDATFRFLMGSDDLFGPRVFDLARTIPQTRFRGDAFVVALQLAANFGRRPEELCSLKATRVRAASNGKAELLYDNFKSKRDMVWLPIDARSAEIVSAWTVRLRQEYPNTPLDELALLPRAQRNANGTEGMGPAGLASWWRGWLTLLEQAIVIGHVVSATGLSLQQVISLRIGNMGGHTLIVDDSRVGVPDGAWQVLVDYRGDVLKRFAERITLPEGGLDELPLFPDPKIRPVREGTWNSQAPRDYTFVTPQHFDALGENWPAVAAQYVSGGIPGRALGNDRICIDLLQVRLFRHTYLQHLVNLGTDIFLVQELADHANVQTTINSYVRVQDDKLREAVDQLAEHRLTAFGRRASDSLPLVSLPTKNIGTNDCGNPQVLALGTEGCEYDRMCFSCSHLTADPSHMPDIKAEVRTCNLSIARIESNPSDQVADGLAPHHLEVLKARRDGWRRMLHVLQDHLEDLDPAEREVVETAANVVRDFRNRIRAGGINFGGGVL